MSNAQVLAHKPPITVGVVASIYLLRSMIQLMSVEMLRSRVALSATLMLAVIFLVRVGLHCSLPLLGRGAFRGR